MTFHYSLRHFPEDSRIDVAGRWLVYASVMLMKDPGDDIARMIMPTHNEIDGRGWGALVDELAKSPSSYEEHLLRNQIRSLLLRALDNRLRALEQMKPRESWLTWDAVEVQDALCIIEHLYGSEPLILCAAKIRLNRICQRISGKWRISLRELEEPPEYFVTFIGNTKHIAW